MSKNQQNLKIGGIVITYILTFVFAVMISMDGTVTTSRVAITTATTLSDSPYKFIAEYSGSQVLVDFCKTDECTDRVRTHPNRNSKSPNTAHVIDVAAFLDKDNSQTVLADTCNAMRSWACGMEYLIPGCETQYNEGEAGPDGPIDNSAWLTGVFTTHDATKKYYSNCVDKTATHAEHAKALEHFNIYESSFVSRLMSGGDAHTADMKEVFDASDVDAKHAVTRFDNISTYPTGSSSKKSILHGDHVSTRTATHLNNAKTSVWFATAIIFVGGLLLAMKILDEERLSGKWWMALFLVMGLALIAAMICFVAFTDATISANEINDGADNIAAGMAEQMRAFWAAQNTMQTIEKYAQGEAAVDPVVRNTRKYYTHTSTEAMNTDNFKESTGELLEVDLDDPSMLKYGGAWVVYVTVMFTVGVVITIWSAMAVFSLSAGSVMKKTTKGAASSTANFGY